MDEKYTVRTALRWIVEQQSKDVFQKEQLINNMLADLAREEESNRQRIKLALSSGAGTMFYRMLQRSGDTLQTQDIRLFRSNLEGYGFTAEFADYVLNTFLYSVSMPVIPMTESVSIGNNTHSDEPKQAGPDPQNKPEPTQKKADPAQDMSLEQIIELANQYEAAEDYQRVVFLIESVISKYPDNASLYNMLGIAYRNTQENIKAIHCYEKALHIEPENGNYWMNKGIAQCTGGKPWEACNSFEKALPILKKTDTARYAKALGNYAYARALTGNAQFAIRLLKEATQLGYPYADRMRRMLEELGIYYH